MKDGVGGGYPEAYRKSDQSEITVRVMDANDNAPYFDWQQKEVKVLENAGKLYKLCLYDKE